MNDLNNTYHDQNKKECCIPKPSELKISTMTVITSIGGYHPTEGKKDYTINLDMLSRFIEIYEENSDQTNNMLGGIVGIDYYSNILRGISKNKSPFYNQTTVIYNYWGFRSINIKIFNNGQLQMTGLINEAESKYVTKFIISKFKNTKYKVYKNLVDIPNNNLYDFNIVYNPKTSKYNYYRYNYNNNYDKFIIDYPNKDKLNGWVSDTQIYNFLNYLFDLIKNCKNSNDLEKTDKLKYLESLYKRLTIIRNKDMEITKEVVLINKDNFEENNDKYWEFNLLDESLFYKLDRTRVELINSNYTTRFNINNTILHNILYKKYKLFSSYEPNDYPGVKNKFLWNKDKSIQDGLCYCPIPCVSLGKKTKCTQITIAIFQSGSIIITGAKNIQQIKDGYEFINNIFKVEYDKILVNSEQSDKSNDFKTNEMRKILRKKRLFYIHKDDIIKNNECL